MFDDIDPTTNVETTDSQTTITAEVGPLELELRFPPILETKAAALLEGGAAVLEDEGELFQDLGDEARELAEELRA